MITPHAVTTAYCLGSVLHSCGESAMCLSVCVQGGGLPDGYDINYVLFGLTGEQAKEKMLHGKVWDE